LGTPVKLWISDKQEAFVKGIAAEFPEVPHRHCGNHFLRDLAKPVLEADSHAKVQMRKKVRGLRAIEKTVLEHQRSVAEGPVPVTAPESTVAVAGGPGASGCGGNPSTDAVVLRYCAAVRGILNDDQGGPLHPPGMRMAEGLGQVRESIQRNLDAKKGGSQRSN